MVTSILEFLFSNHYLYDADNRFTKRIKNVKILNNLKDAELGKTRLNKALFHYGLGILDKTSIALQPIAIVFGNIFFRENGKITQAELEIEGGRTGNVYVAIMSDQTVVTLKLFSINTTNQEISDDIERHDGTKIKALYDMDNNVLNMTDKKRKTIIVDLDVNDSDFLTMFPAPILKNNPYNKGGNGVSKADMVWINNDKPVTIEKPIMSGHVIPSELKQYAPEKEWGIGKGTVVLVRYPDGIREKTVQEIMVDDKGPNKKYSLRFEKTLNTYSLNVGGNFIISPKQQTDTYVKLMNAFALNPDDNINFEGPIRKFMDYMKKSKPTLGIVIDPKSIVY